MLNVFPTERLLWRETLEGSGCAVHTSLSFSLSLTGCLASRSPPAGPSLWQPAALRGKGIRRDGGQRNSRSDSYWFFYQHVAAALIVSHISEVVSPLFLSPFYFSFFFPVSITYTIGSGVKQAPLQRLCSSLTLCLQADSVQKREREPNSTSFHMWKCISPCLHVQQQDLLTCFWQKMEEVSKVLGEVGLILNTDGVDCVGVQDLNLSVEDFLRHAGRRVDWWSFVIKEPKWCLSLVPSPLHHSCTYNYYYPFLFCSNTLVMYPDLLSCGGL